MYALRPSSQRCDEEGAEREREQQEAERRRPSLVELGADDREEDLGGQHAEVAAEQDRIAEVRERLDEAHQERVGEPGPHQRQRDVGEDAPAPGAQRLRRFLDAGRHALDHADQHQERDRREREHLRDQHALHAVDPARGLDREGPLEQLVDEAGAAEEQDQAEADARTAA